MIISFKTRGENLKKLEKSLKGAASLAGNILDEGHLYSNDARLKLDAIDTLLTDARNYFQLIEKGE